MPVRIDLTSNASVRLVDVNEDNLGCAYLANLYIPIFSLETSKIIRRFEVANQIAGIHFTHRKKNVFYAIDDSFGLHTFDTRTDSKKKARLNPESENHNVVATALSSNGETLAVASAEFGGGILDVRGSRRRENHPHVVSLYDTRMASEPITSYYKRFKAEVTGMDFYMNGHDLLIGDQSGSIQVFDTTLRDEDNAFRWGRYVKGPITKVGIINKRIVYTVSNKSEATVFVDAKGKLEVLFGAVSETPISSFEVSKAFFKKPEWCAGLVKGVDDNLPLVAVHGVENKNFISLTALDQNGIREDAPMLSYIGHVGEVKCMTATPELLLTGGEDGKVVVQIANFRNPKFGEDMIEHHRLTIKRGNLADSEDNGKEESSEDEENSEDEDDGKKPSTSTAKPTSSASSSSSSSSPVKKVKKESDKEDSDDNDSSESNSSDSDEEKDPKEKEKERKKKERERRKQLKREKEKEERRKAKEKKKKDKEEKERKEKEAAKAKKRAAREAKEQEEADRKRQAKEAKRKEREAKEEAEREEKRKEKERKKQERAELKAKEQADKSKEDQEQQKLKEQNQALERQRQEEARLKERREAKERHAREVREAARAAKEKEREAALEKERELAKAAKESKKSSSSTSSKEEKDKKNKPSTSSAASSSSSTFQPSSSYRTEEEWKARQAEKVRQKAERRARERAENPAAFDAEREQRRLLKLSETPEQRAERKQKAREERRKRELEERASAQNGTKRPRTD